MKTTADSGRTITSLNIMIERLPQRIQTADGVIVLDIDWKIPLTCRIS